MSTDSQPSTEQPTKMGLLHKIKKLFGGSENIPANASPREEEEPRRVLTPEELELENLLTFFTDVMYELSPYNPKLKEKLEESNTSLVEVSPVYLGDPLTLLSAEFFDGMCWNIIYTQEKKCDALNKYLSAPYTPTLETVVESDETETNDRSHYSQPEHHNIGDNVPAQVTSAPAESTVTTDVLVTDALAPQSTTDASSTSSTPAFFALLPQNLIQRRLKEITSLTCIPTIHFTQLSLDPADGLNWIVEDNPFGVRVRLHPTSPSCAGKSARLEIFVHGKWTRLRRRMKERFLDDLARIQVAYSSITSDRLGPLVPVEVTDETSGMFNRLVLKESCIIADIEDTFPTPKDYVVSLSQDSFISHLVSKATQKVTFTTGPYPLGLPGQIFENLLVDPVTGNITRLSQSWNTGTVPWELAALPPLNLSPKAEKRYNYSLKRHYFGALVRNRGCDAEGPKLYEFAAAEGREVWECIGAVGKVDRMERMVNVVLGKKGWEREKRKWDEGIIV